MRRTPRISHQRGAGLGAEPLDDVEHAGGQPGLGGDVGEQRRGERRPLRRLGDHGVARGERRGDPPGRQHQRRVPGRDRRRSTRPDPTRRGCGDHGSRSRGGAAGADGRRRTGSSAPPAASRRGGGSGAASRCRGSRPGRGPRAAPRRRRRSGAGPPRVPVPGSPPTPGTRRSAAATAASTSAGPRGDPRDHLARRSARCRRRCSADATRSATDPVPGVDVDAGDVRGGHRPSSPAAAATALVGGNRSGPNITTVAGRVKKSR